MTMDSLEKLSLSTTLGFNGTETFSNLGALIENTENSFVLAMEYSLSEKFNHQFDIHAIPSVGEVTHVFSLTYPLTESYDELLPSVFDVYQEFLNNYVNSVSSNSDSTIQENTALEKPSSYISSLISV
jgi:hypothetical protein